MKEFYDTIRPLFGGKLKKTQIDGIECILREAKALPISHKAYLLATTFHETAFTMEPIYERGQRAYFRKYEPGTKIGAVLGNVIADDGFRFRGRGFVQLTGRANYRKAGLENNPDDALLPAVAAAVLVEGCTQGWFTGNALSDYLPGDYVNARRVVNGTDKAQVIAGYARHFEAALRAIKEPLPNVPARPATAPARPQVTTAAPSTAKGPTFGLAGVFSAIAALIAAGVAYFLKG